MCSNMSGAGFPSGLKEEERRKLARYFAISEALLGGPVDERSARDRPGRVKRHPVSRFGRSRRCRLEELGKPYFAFDERWLKDLTAVRPPAVDRPGRRRFDGADAQ